MHISWHGFSCVSLQTGDTTVLINPYQDTVGVQMPRLKAQIVAVTEPGSEQTNNAERIQGDPLVIETPGEYEIHGVFFYGIPHTSEQNLYVIEAEGLSVGHPGILSSPLSDAELELFEGVDVLFLPVSSINTKIRSEFISRVEPRIIIPIQYKTRSAKIDLEEIDGFLKEMGVQNPPREKKLVVKEKNLPAEETAIIVLEHV